ncbi:1-deoxy-D-xylulose-5-phosphate synthase [Streptomyces rishiriensis]|uniref:1-deoxy-D-xylulose-5-phosphate synthase n=1 Tax=Streptomyces rishiriensis TaxID=68264 RepID=A0ABU0P2M7_STRRH|nr:1-deoxy-D-xylulose-5-phosphate synthase [Streptomyces rishiriensis]MDQ0585651.1 1-deoxy-D-xylulose-5-phosphate synthase [Streptomyces rishiriensis]
MTLLQDITSPADLRGLDRARDGELCAEIREFLVQAVAESGGHLGPNLGMVELTVALHRVFESPRDVLLFDVGHQAYVHKLLTGRARRFGSLRSAGGLSGYPSRAESDHDVIENSHASTVLSYADGMAKAFALRGDHDRKLAAVVGDGGLTGGLAWEALNNIGAAPERPMVIVLNDNGRSYRPTAGALARHLDAIGTRSADRSDFFESLGIAYLGAVDGHDCAAVEEALWTAVRMNRPVVVHCLTKKGHGYAPAAQDAEDRWHAVGRFDAVTGAAERPGTPSWTEIFADEMLAVAAERPEVVGVTAAMTVPVGLHKFAAKFPDRVYDVGISEQHAVASAAGLAIAGLRPVVAIYSTFLARAFDQVLMDVALHRLPVVFVLDRAGVTGPDGPSHHGMWDLSWLSLVPGLRVAAPRDTAQLRLLLRDALDRDDGPTVLRFPKGQARPGIEPVGQLRGLDVLRSPKAPDVLLAAAGPMAAACVEAAGLLAVQGVEATVVDPRWVVPVPDALVELARTHPLTVTVEDNIGTGGFGERLGRSVAAAGATTRVANLSLPTRFLEPGGRDELLHACGLSAPRIAEQVLAWTKATTGAGGGG